jgi:acetyl-CoA synthetase
MACITPTGKSFSSHFCYHIKNEEPTGDQPMPENINIASLCTSYQIEQGRGEKTALRWIDADFTRTDVSFAMLERESNRYANAFRALGYGKGDRIFLYLAPLPEVYFSFLGILKVQAIAGLLFSNFGKSAIYDRLADAEAKVIITKQEPAQARQRRHG